MYKDHGAPTLNPTIKSPDFEAFQLSIDIFLKNPPVNMFIAISSTKLLVDLPKKWFYVELKGFKVEVFL